MGHLGKLICLVVCLIGWQGAIAEGNPTPAALYRSGDQLLFTFAQYEALVQAELADLSPSFQVLDQPVTYRDQQVPALVLSLDGIQAGNKITQELTYVQAIPGLWQLAWVRGRHCIRGEALREGVWVQDWFCDSKGMEAPFSRHVAHLYILTNEAVDINAIAQSLGREIVANEPAPSTPATVTETPSLGDLRQWIENQGFQWTQSLEMWTPALRPEETPRQALRIRVSGRPMVGHNFEQSFLYLIEGDELALREIQGRFCQYIERMGKDICNIEDGYYPSRYTPFPMRLINTAEVLGRFRRTESVSSASPANLTCNRLSGVYQDINRFHLERGLFSAFDLEQVEEALSGFVNAVDPNRFFFQGMERSRLEGEIATLIRGSSGSLDHLIAQLQAGDRGNCDVFNVVSATLHNQLLSQSPVLAQLLDLAQSQGFSSQSIHAAIAAAPAEVQTLWQKIQSLPLPRHLAPEIAERIRLAEVQKYLAESLAMTQDPEWLALASFADLDIYSQMLRPSLSQSLQETLHGTAQRLYFGLSVVDAFGQFWVNNTHPQMQSSEPLQIGDEILEINGLDSTALSAAQVDEQLLNTQQTLELKIQRQGEIRQISVQASALNPVELTYQLGNWSEAPGAPLKLTLRSFESGLSESLRPRLLQALEQNPNGLVIDLRGNPGGNVEEALKVLSYFIQGRPLTHYRMGSRSGSPVQTREPMPEEFISETVPLVVLIDRNTMSASEIFASALKDLGRAVLIGERSHGKLVGQNIFQLGETRRRTPLNLLITTTEYYSPAGMSLNQLGVSPDIEWSENATTPRVQLVDGLGPGQNLTDLIRPTGYQTSMLEFELF